MFCESVEVFETENISTWYLNRIDFGGYIPVHLVYLERDFEHFDFQAYNVSISSKYWSSFVHKISYWWRPYEHCRLKTIKLVITTSFFSNELDLMLILSWYLLFFSSFMFVCCIGLPFSYTNCILRNLLPTIIQVKLITACKQCSLTCMHTVRLYMFY